MINNPINPILEVAYLYYYATEVGLQAGDNQEEGVKQRLMSLIGDALVVANEAKFDVFNALTLMDNVPVLEDLKVLTYLPISIYTILYLASLGLGMAF